MISEVIAGILIAILVELFRIERVIGKMRSDLAKVTTKIEILEEAREKVRVLERKCPLLKEEE